MEFRRVLFRSVCTLTPISEPENRAAFKDPLTFTLLTALARIWAPDCVFEALVPSEVCACTSTTKIRKNKRQCRNTKKNLQRTRARGETAFLFRLRGSK